MEFVGEVAIVEAAVDSLQEGGDPLADLPGQAPPRGLAPRAVDQAAGPAGPEADLEPLELPDREAQGGRALGVGDAPGQGGLDEARARDFLSAHREGLHGATFSRSS